MKIKSNRIAEKCLVLYSFIYECVKGLGAAANGRDWPLCSTERACILAYFAHLATRQLVVTRPS